MTNDIKEPSKKPRENFVVGSKDVGSQPLTHKPLPLLTDNERDELEYKQGHRNHNREHCHKSGCRTLLDDIANSLLGNLLCELLVLVPFGLAAWVFITWGAIWLFVPLVVIVILIYLQWRGRKS